MLEAACSSKEDGEFRVERVERGCQLGVLALAPPRNSWHAKPGVVIVSKPAVLRRNLVVNAFDASAHIPVARRVRGFLGRGGRRGALLGLSGD